MRPGSVGRHGRGWVCSTKQHCNCEDEVRWAYVAAGVALCESCCFALARGFVQEGLLEPVLELTWPEFRVGLDSILEREAA